jgi:tetratricopeptide (TPR) repeat protein
MLFTMRICLTALIFALPFAAAAQDLPAPEPLPVPPIEIERPQIEIVPTPDETEQETEAETIEGEDIVPDSLAPDYSKLSPKAERAARLNDLFVKLAERDDEESANLVAEEIVAIWTESGSASVNLLLRRGSEATAKGDAKLARKMYNYAVDLSPEYAEAWARSARLALTQKQYNRALNESLKTLQLEPRHFYTLWTLGNVFEVLNRQDEALEAYREANRLYPELKAVKDRLEELEIEIGGTVL